MVQATQLRPLESQINAPPELKLQVELVVKSASIPVRQLKEPMKLKETVEEPHGSSGSVGSGAIGARGTGASQSAQKLVAIVPMSGPRE